MGIIGLTGLIGSGKSLASNYFAELGIEIIDTDSITYELTSNNGQAILPIRAKFGIDYIINGNVNRHKLRNLVFQDDNARVNLETILHPLIFDLVITKIKVAQSPYVVIVVPLLFKIKEYLQIIDRSIFVDAKIATILERVKKRSNLTVEQIKQIIAKQIPANLQRKLATDIIVNNFDTGNLTSQVAELHKKYLKIYSV